MRTPSRPAIASIPTAMLVCCSRQRVRYSCESRLTAKKRRVSFIPGEGNVMSTIAERSRRQFLKFLSASPVFAAGAYNALAGEGPVAGVKLPDPIVWAPLKTETVIKTPKEAINVFDFEPACRATVPPAHFGYMASGIDDEVTLRANREGFLKFQLRPRRLVDVSKIDMSTDILGVKYASPI